MNIALTLWLDLETRKMGSVKPNCENRNVHTIRMGSLFDVSLIVAQLTAVCKDKKSVDVIKIEIEVPEYIKPQ